MVTVRRSQQQVQQQAARGIQTNLTITPSQLGADVGQGITSLAGDVARLAGDARRKAGKARLDQLNIDLDNAELEILKGTQDQPGGYLSKEMRDAGASYEEYYNQYKSRVEAARKDLPSWLEESANAIIERKDIGMRSSMQSHLNAQESALEQYTVNRSSDLAMEKALLKRNDPNAVIHEIGSLANVIRGFADTEDEKSLAEEHIKEEMGKIYTAIVKQAITDGSEQQINLAKQYLDDFMVTDNMRPEAIEAFQERIKKADMAIDSRKQAAMAVKHALEDDDLTVENLQRHLDKIDAEYPIGGTEEQARENKIRTDQMRTHFAEAKRERDMIKASRLDKFRGDIENLSPQQALEAIEKMPEDEQAPARAVLQSVKGQTTDKATEQKKSRAEQLALKTEIRNVIRNTPDYTVGRLYSEWQDKLTIESLKELEGEIGPEAENKLRKEQARDIEGIVEDLYPDLSKKEKDTFKAAMVERVLNIIGTGTFTPERVRSIITTYQAAQEGRAEFVNTVVSPGGVRLLVRSDTDPATIGLTDLSTVLNDDVDVDDPEQFDQFFGNIYVTELSDQEMEDTKRAMVAKGLDPTKADPINFYNTNILDRPEVGVKTYGVEARMRSEAFKRKVQMDRVSEAKEKQALGYLRESTRYESPDKMLLELHEMAYNGEIPQWMERFLVDSGDVMSPIDKRRISKYELFVRSLQQHPNPSEQIRRIGESILTRMAGN